MAEYIAREAVIDRLKRNLNACNPGSFSELCYRDVIETVKWFPTADVAPVVHGDWLLRHIGAGHYWECSVCHTNPCIYVTEHTKFCPNCGAKMDGGDSNV